MLSPYPLRSPCPAYSLWETLASSEPSRNADRCPKLPQNPLCRLNSAHEEFYRVFDDLFLLQLALVNAPREGRLDSRRQCQMSVGNDCKQNDSLSFLQLQACGQKSKDRETTLGINPSVLGDVRNGRWDGEAEASLSVRRLVPVPHSLYLGTIGAGLYCFQGLFVHRFFFFRINIVCLITG